MTRSEEPMAMKDEPFDIMMKHESKRNDGVLDGELRGRGGHRVSRA